LRHEEAKGWRAATGEIGPRAGMVSAAFVAGIGLRVVLVRAVTDCYPIGPRGGDRRGGAGDGGPRLRNEARKPFSSCSTRA
jgi:hypothetical protein